jgi:transposase
MSRKGRMTLRAKVKQRSADDRAKRRAATMARRKVEHLERCRIGKERKELRASGREDEAKALHRPRRKARKSVRGSRLVSKISSQHADVVHMRDDVQHKTTTVVTRQIKVLCLDHVPGNGGFGASDAALGKMRTMFGYKGALDGCLIIDAWQFFPSSKRCSVCGHIHADLKRGDGMWVCSECDTRHGRDINAAQNLEWYGRIALAIRKGGDAADSALSGLTDVERSWFMSDFADAKRQVGQARAELTRGETTRAPIGCRPSRSRERVGDQLCSLP